MRGWTLGGNLILSGSALGRLQSKCFKGSSNNKLLQSHHFRRAEIQSLYGESLLFMFRACLGFLEQYAGKLVQ
jgi:hypothetical protein